MNFRSRWRLSHLLVAAILGIAGFTLVLMATDPPGPGLDPDAVSYMGAAESLAWQGRYRIPTAAWWRTDSTGALTHFPPGFPTALALPVRAGMTAPQAARLVSALSAAVTVGTLVLLVAGAATLAAGALLGVALLAMPAMELVHVSVLSEPLFLACVALMLAELARDGSRPLVVGLASAVATLTRYAGAALVGAGAVWLLAAPGSRRERLRRAGLALLPTLVLQGLWVVRTRRLHEPGGIRQVAVYGDLWPTLRQGATTLRDWLVPDPNAWSDPVPHHGAVGAAAGALVLLVLAVGVRRAVTARQGVPQPARLLAACGLLAACYAGMVVASRLLADPGIPFDVRILSPLLLLVMTALVTAAASWWREASRVPRLALGAGVAAWLAASALTSYGNAGYLLGWGSDFAGEQWRRSELLAWGRTNGATHALYSNWPAAVYFHLQRPARYVPVIRDTMPLATFADSVRAHDGRVLVFTTGEPGYLSATAVRALAGLRVVAELEDGVVLAATP